MPALRQEERNWYGNWIKDKKPDLIIFSEAPQSEVYKVVHLEFPTEMNALVILGICVHTWDSVLLLGKDRDALSEDRLDNFPEWD